MNPSIIFFILFFLNLVYIPTFFVTNDLTDSIESVEPDSAQYEEKAPLIHPDTLEQRIQTARRLAKEYKFDRASETLERLFQQDTTSTEVMRELEDIYYSTSQTSKAMEMVNRLLNAGVDSSIYMPHKALLLKKEGDISHAKEIFLQLIENDSTNTFFLNQLAEVFSDFQLTDSAMTYYTRSAEISPKSSTIYKAGQLLLEKDKQKKAKDFFEQFYDPEVHTEKPLRRLYGQTVYLLDEIEESIHVFSELYQNGDSSFITTKFLGMSYRKNGEFTKGEQALKQALKRNSQDFLVFYNLGICSQKIGRVEEGEKYLNTAMQLATTSPIVKNMINRQLAHVYEKQMKWEKALALYQSILETDPSNFRVRMDALFIIDYQLKNRDLALKKYKESLNILQQDSLNTIQSPEKEKIKAYFSRRIKKLQEEEFWSAGSEHESESE